MVLFPDQPFSEGAEWTPDLAYEAFKLYFDDQPQYLSHRERLTDAELSNAPDAIKARVAAIEAAFMVSEVSGLTVAYNAGQVILPNGLAAAVPGGQLVVADNATDFLWVNDQGVVETGATPPVTRVLLARVTTSGGAISVLEDLRSPALRRVLPVTRSIRSFGGNNQMDYVAVQADRLDAGLYFYRNFTVPSGVTISVDQFARIVCSGVVNIQGTITVDPMARGWPEQSFVTTSSGAVGGAPGNGLGGTGVSYPWGAQLFGSAGQQGSARTSSGTSYARIGKAGDGGGGLQIEAAGAITIGGAIRVKGGDALAGTTQNFDGGSFNAGAVNGSGGGSGGLIYLASLDAITASPGSELDVRGGNGADGFHQTASNSAAHGGSPGSGGYIVFLSPDTNTTDANLLTAGGAWGIPDNMTEITPGSVYETADNFNLGPVGRGGGYGGSSADRTQTDTGSKYRWEYPDSDAGQTVYRNFVPLS